MRGLIPRRIAALCLASAALALLIAASAFGAFGSLPPDGPQVNNDLGAGINPADPVDLENPTNVDVVGGALTAGGKAVPWAIFRQKETAAGQHDQIFVRAFKGGAWVTQGSGTGGGKSSATPIFSGSLNFDQTTDGEAPAIDFAGAGRTVPWASWYESTTAFGGANNIFASRFDPASNRWIFAGRDRGSGIPSLNIRTNKNAENPSVAGGSAVDPTKPGPWITWQERGVNPTTDQIFVVKPIGPGTTTCPAGTKPTPASTTVLGGFCCQQVGIEREAGDPSLNVDRARDGVEPDIAFTGANDSVPWVVWYEQNTGTPGLHTNEMVFAARGSHRRARRPPARSAAASTGSPSAGRARECSTTRRPQAARARRAARPREPAPSTTT